MDELELDQLKETVDYLEKQHKVHVKLLEKLAEIVMENTLIPDELTEEIESLLTEL